MAKKIKAIIKLQIEAGKANPAPPVGPALGQHGINIMGFCKEYNDRTASQAGSIIPVEIIAYEDNSFTFVTKTPPPKFIIPFVNEKIEKSPNVPIFLLLNSAPNEWAQSSINMRLLCFAI